MKKHWIWQKTFSLNLLDLHQQDKDIDKVQDLSIIYPLFTLIIMKAASCVMMIAGDDVMWTQPKYLYFIFRMFAHKIFGNSASKYCKIVLTDEGR